MFALVLELFSIAVRANIVIEGLQVRHKIMKIRLYLDAIVCYLRNSWVSIKALSQLMGNSVQSLDIRCIKIDL